MSFSDDVAGLLLILLLVGVFALSGVVTVMGLRLAKLRRDYSAALGESQREGLFEAVREQRRELDVLREDLGTVDGKAETLRTLLAATTSRVAVVRYDAFEDMGGMLSFSAALLDEHGDGVVISTINGRTEARTYAKAIRASRSEQNLSEEEERAIADALAMSGRTHGEAAKPRRRRRVAT